MLLLLRSIFIIVYSLLVCTIGIVWCLFSPRNPRHVARFSRIFSYLSKILGLKIELRNVNGDISNYGNVVYIANHQNNYDIIVAGSMVQPGTVTVGKNTLLWIPFFGQLYWLTGNILIDRSNFVRAYSTINTIIKKLTQQSISLWIFPEGRRSHGKGLLPFKSGAFHIAITSKVPIIPIVISNTHNKIKLNRWNNGLVIVEMLPVVHVSQYTSMSVSTLSQHCRKLMLDKLLELNKEVKEREDKKFN